MKNKIKGNKNVIQSGYENLSIADSEVTIVKVSTKDKINELMSQGKQDEAIKLLQYYRKQLESSHPFSPFYKYEIIDVGDRTLVKHSPINKQAAYDYPLSYKTNFTVDDNEINGFTDLNELIENAFFKRKKVKINLLSLQAIIGSEPVHTPHLNEFIKGNEWFIAPIGEPPILKLNLYIKNPSSDIIIDYLEMSINEFNRKKGYMIINNDVQEESKLQVSMLIPLVMSTDGNSFSIVSAEIILNMKTREGYEKNVSAHKILLNFLDVISENKHPLAFKELVSGKDFMVAENYINKPKDDKLDFELEIIKRLSRLEDFFKLTFELPDTISKNEFEGIELLESIMNNTFVEKKLDKLELSGIQKESVESLISYFDKGDEDGIPFYLERSGVNPRIELFGAIIPIEKIELTYKSLRIFEIEKIKEKYKFMDCGDNITIKFIPGSNPIFKERVILKNDESIRNWNFRKKARL